MTVEEFQRESLELLKDIFNDTEALLLAGTSVVGIMAKRIFTDQENPDGVKLLSIKPYDTKPIYLSRDIAGAATGTFVGKSGKVVKSKTKTSIGAGSNGKEIKSAYFPGGYNQFKQQLGRGALELSGRLKSEFEAPFYGVKEGELTVKFKSEKENAIAVGNETGNGRWEGRGEIFSFSEFEMDEFARIHLFELERKGVV